MSIRIDRVYTRGGDDGTTHLALGGRVSKDCHRIEAVGAVDELNSAIGAACEEIRALPEKSAALKAELAPRLRRIQEKLFDLGAHLASAHEKTPEGMPAVSAEDVRLLEEEIDSWLKELPPLKGFILPGGGRAGALLHVSRATCRRAERAAVRVHRTEPFSKPLLPFLNRLSDWLFVASRHAAKALGEPEVLWKPPDRPR